MDIFESLENLNVSEECFEDIIYRVEENLYDVVGRAEKKGIVSPEKAEKLKEKGLQISSKERLDSQNRDFASKGIGKYEAREQVDNKRQETKNSLGAQKTDNRRLDIHTNNTKKIEADSSGFHFAKPQKIIARSDGFHTSKSLAQDAIDKHADEKDKSLTRY